MTEFVNEAEEGLGILDSLFIKLEAEPHDLETINAIFRPVHTIKGNSAFFGLMKVKKLAHEMETLLTLAKQETLALNPAIISVLLMGLDQLKEMLVRTRDGKAEVTDEAGFEALIKKIIAAKESKEDNLVLWDELFSQLDKAKTDFAKLDSACTKQLENIVTIANQLKAGETSVDSQVQPKTAESEAGEPKPQAAAKKILQPKKLAKRCALPKKASIISSVMSAN